MNSHATKFYGGLADSSRYEMYLEKHKKKQNKGARIPHGTFSYKTADSERQKCYNAEHRFIRKMDIKKYDTIEEMRKSAKVLYKTATWLKLWSKSIEDDVGKIFNSNPEIVMRKGRGGSTIGSTNGHTVYITGRGMDQYTLLHELAHTLGHMHHGRSFRQCLVSLVGVFMGAAHKKELKAQFKLAKLPCGEARKPMSFENWVATKNRMEKMREQL